MSGAIETIQLQPLDHDANQRRAAALTCAVHIAASGGNHEDLLELLRALGLVHDPHALDRNPLAGTTGVYKLRGDRT